MRIRTAARVLQLLTRLVGHDPRAVRFAPSWLQSQRKGHTGIVDARPAITFRALAWLDEYLKPDMTVFEYGTGGSTLLFSRRVKEVVSVEHHAGWHSMLTAILTDRGARNCRLLLAAPEPLPAAHESSYFLGSFTSTHRDYKDVRFEQYVRSIDPFPDHSFDLVLVDGRSRPSCILHSLTKIKEGGYLMLDNSERAEYGEVKALPSRLPRRDFYGIGPYSDRLWQTSVWQISADTAAVAAAAVVKVNGKQAAG